MPMDNSSPSMTGAGNDAGAMQQQQPPTAIVCPKCGCQIALSAQPMDDSQQPPPENQPPEMANEPDGDEYDQRVADMQAMPGARKFQDPRAVAGALRQMGGKK